MYIRTILIILAWIASVVALKRDTAKVELETE